jgi:hypothetical protein
MSGLFRMMKIFRRYRKNSLMSNKVGEYLKYAVGEIVLVVIGILLALQINSWSEARKDRQTELYILQEVLSNLKEDSVIIQDIIFRRMRAQVASKNMLNYLPVSGINEDTLSSDLTKFITFERYFPIRNAFEVLKSKGLKLSDNSLTTRISRYFDFEQNRIKGSIYDIEHQILPVLTNQNGLRRFFASVTFNVNVEVLNPGDPVFRKELYNELVNFRDNNAGTLGALTLFRDRNVLLASDIRSEVNRLTGD